MPESEPSAETHPKTQPEKIELLALDAPPMIAGEPEPVAANVTDETESGASLEVKFGKVWLVRIGVVLVLTGRGVLANLGYQGLNPEIRPYINPTLLYLWRFGMLAPGLFPTHPFAFLKTFP